MGYLMMCALSAWAGRSGRCVLPFLSPAAPCRLGVSSEPSLPRHGRSGPAFACPQPQSAWQLARFADGPTPIGPARSGMHVAYGDPRRHTMPSAPAVVKRGWGWPYFSQPICGDDRSLFSPAPSPLVPRQWAQSANSLGKWRARQDSNLRPSA